MSPGDIYTPIADIDMIVGIDDFTLSNDKVIRLKQHGAVIFIISIRKNNERYPIAKLIDSETGCISVAAKDWIKDHFDKVQ